MRDGHCAYCLLAAALVSEPPPLTSRRVGDYELQSEIARGGMGVVFRARQISLKRPVAIKMILAGELASRESIQRFYVEAEAAANLRHPNIVAVYDMGECDNEHYLVMELVDHGKLAHVPGRDPKETAAIIAKVARALAFAHEHGVLHRDLKPSNILLDESGEPKLTDFGLAKITAQDGSLTVTNATIGSPGYMSPEQAAQGEVTTLSDVYGLGAVLYEVLSGSPPFAGHTVVDTMWRVVNETPKPLPVSVPKDLATICMRCLAKRPTARYASARELAEDCERYVRGELILARPVSRSEQLTRLTKQHPKSTALVAITILSVLLGIGGVFTQWQKAERATAEQAQLVKHLLWQRISGWLEDDEPSRALAYLGTEIRKDPDNWRAAMYAMSIVDQNSFPMVSGPAIHPPSRLTTPALISPCGVWIAGAGEDRHLRFWEVSTGQEMANLVMGSDITAMAVGIGQHALAFATEDGRVQVMTGPKSKPTLLTRSKNSPIKGLAISINGAAVLIWGATEAEVVTGTAPSLPLPLNEEIKGAALDASGSRVLVWSKSNAILYDAATAQKVHEMKADRSFIGGTLSRDGNRLVLIDSPNCCRAWDIKAKRELPRLQQPLSTWSMVTMNAEGNRATAAGHGHDLTMYDLDSGLVVGPPMRHHYFLRSLVASANGRSMASIAADGIVRLWDASSGKSLVSPIWIWKALADPWIGLSGDGELLLVHTPPYKDTPEALTVWTASAKRSPARKQFRGSSNFDAGQMSPDETLGLVGLLPLPRALVYELKSGKVILDKPTAGGVYDLQISPDRKNCYAMTANGWFYGWSLESGDELWKPEKQPGAVRPVAMNDDGTRIIAGHNDGHIRVYDTSTGRVLMTLDHPGEIKSLRFAPDGGGRFVSSSTDTNVHLWDLKSGSKLQSYTGHTHTVLSTAWSKDCRFLATASYDSTARVWDVVTGKLIGQPMAHATWLSHLEFSPDGKTLATACRDGTAILWNPFTGRPLLEPIRVGEVCEAVRYTADGAVFMARDVHGFQFFDSKTGDAVTQFFRERAIGSVGIDSVGIRSFMSKDGTKVFLAASMDDAAYWTIAQPRGKSSPWLADLVEALALTRLDNDGNIVLVAGARLDRVKQVIRQLNASDPYVKWARHALRMN